ncbi:YciI family protein [Fodinicola feengrottensis]|uniref:YciI family protein n=1 Tax=Fodinicola feengrottensis TaxID=435914 RepID=UPI002442E132|nr:YciI family protein [Fodinicola feengrottensis]
MEDIHSSGELIDSAALADPSTSRIVRLKDGVEEATDGPFAEAKEQLAGYFVIDCENVERATEVAARFPDAKFAGVEVRPIMEPCGMEM